MTKALNHKLQMYKMMIQRFIAGVSNRNGRRNADIRKELVINHDVVDLVRQRRLQAPLPNQIDISDMLSA